MMTNQLTTEEARAIVRIVHFGIGKRCGITDAAYEQALAIVKASEPPVVVYPKMDWYQDDDSEAYRETDDEYREWVQQQDDYQEMLRS